MAVGACTLPLAGQRIKGDDIRPTPVEGESWLTHLERSFNDTGMGKTGRLGPPGATDAEMGETEYGMGEASDGARPQRTKSGFAGDPVRERGRGASIRNVNLVRARGDGGRTAVYGEDLYRMNCRGCHGEAGLGAPPEINSVINPVRATSAAAILERVRTTGAEMSRADAAKLAQQSRTMLLDRLHHGGQDMPAFPHLSDAEVDSLIAYLRQLAAVPGAEREQRAVMEQRERIGEHVAKSTCHICHSASGPNPTAQELFEGVIPPLSTLTMRTTRAEFIRKVTAGAPIVMGTPPESLRGRMPVFYYLSEEEAADIYLYLTRNPPSRYRSDQWVTVEAASGSQLESQAGGVTAAPIPGEFSKPGAGTAENQNKATLVNARMAAIPKVAGVFVALFLVFGLVFTVCEVRRLSASGKTAAQNEKAVVDDRNQVEGKLVA